MPSIKPRSAGRPCPSKVPLMPHISLKVPPIGDKPSQKAADHRQNSAVENTAVMSGFVFRHESYSLLEAGFRIAEHHRQSANNRRLPERRTLQTLQRKKQQPSSCQIVDFTRHQAGSKETDP